MFSEPERRERSLLPFDPLKAIVALRQIGWTTSISLPAGAFNPNIVALVHPRRHVSVTGLLQQFSPCYPETLVS